MALILSSSVYSIGWILTSLLNMKYEDCSVIAIDMICKFMCLSFFVVGDHLLQSRIVFAPEFPSAVLLMTSLVLLTHLLLNKIGYVADRTTVDLSENIPKKKLEITEKTDLPFTITQTTVPMKSITNEKFYAT